MNGSWLKRMGAALRAAFGAGRKAGDSAAEKNPAKPARQRRYPGRKKPSRRDRAALAAVSDGIGQHAAAFDGLYESLYQSAQNRQMFVTDAYQEWCNRVGQLHDQAFQAAFDRFFSERDLENEPFCRKQYALLLRCIDAAGICRNRDSGMNCTADETLCRAYVEAGSQQPQLGSTYTVLKSAWICGEKVIEYGLVMPGSFCT